ncbi:MAG: RnfABCDGE type electron transport complex subunit G [Desulfobacterales bacterium]|nr:RnfABCDGE type electron transport complex subunit G [Desulfobacterales bacterium]MCP4161562.1 RnfABCDGE type electron transport complex subunit G [Deltaproteobacteria bacterium]
MGKFKDNYIVKAWLVLSIALIFGSSLAGVEIVLKPKIIANKLNETLSLIPYLIQEKEKEKSQNLKITFNKVEIEKNERKIFYNVIHTSRDGKTAGWVVKSKGPGYADKVELLIGFDPNMKYITGLFVIDQKETPGLGNKIIENNFRNQFLRINTENSLVAVKTGKRHPGEIDAITGATISSRSVCDIVNTVVKDLKQPLGSGSIKK